MPQRRRTALVGLLVGAALIVTSASALGAAPDGQVFAKLVVTSDGRWTCAAVSITDAGWSSELNPSMANERIRNCKVKGGKFTTVVAGAVE
jgi:hypothetical protein